MQFVGNRTGSLLIETARTLSFPNIMTALLDSRYTMVRMDKKELVYTDQHELSKTLS